MAELTLRRKDALRTRRAILDAAHGLLSIDQYASFADIAHAAGVGQATVYRHFPERQDLVAALLEEVVDRLEEDAGREPDDARAFDTLLRTVVAEQTRCQGLISVIRREDVRRDRLEALEQRVLTLFRRPLAAARRAGRLRPWLTVEQVPLLLAMVDGALAEVTDPRGRDEAAARALEVVLGGVLSDPAGPSLPTES
jgi:AcrR family transcriptional regulator